MEYLELERNIGALLEKAGQKYGDKIVITVDHHGLSLSFSELDQKVNQFANALSQNGINSGDHVGVMLPNCMEFPCVWLALAKLGAVMVPINIRYQETDLEYVLKNSDAVALVMHTNIVDVYNKISIENHGVKQLFCIGSPISDKGIRLSELAANMSVIHKSADPNLNDLMNIQYTSGTTGFAKGVMTTHEYWLSCGVIASSLGFNSSDTFLSMSPFYYMDPQWELIMALNTGGTIVIAEKISAENFVRCVKKYPITITWGSEDFLYLNQFKEDKKHHLKLALLSAFSPDLHKEFENHFNVIAREVYGMTEIGAGSSVPIEDTHMVGSGSVGKPVVNRDFRIISSSGKDVAHGEVGELLVKGQGILKGYYNNPEATKNAFYEGYFKTGDLFRQDDKGYYYFAGRIKDMIRRMGDNISTEEIENVLMNHPKILEAAIIGVPDKKRDEEVKAYVIPAPGETSATIPPEEIVEYCLKKVAKFKVPRYIEYKDDFPRSASNKIQKNKLAEEKVDLTADCFDRFARS